MLRVTTPTFAASPFLSWQFALKTFQQSHQSLKYPSPSTCTQLLCDSNEMPPRLRLALFTLLAQKKSFIDLLPQSHNSHISSSSPLRAYTAALEAADRVTQREKSRSVIQLKEFDRIQSISHRHIEGKASTFINPFLSVGTTTTRRFPALKSIPASEWLSEKTWKTDSSTTSSKAVDKNKIKNDDNKNENNDLISNKAHFDQTNLTSSALAISGAAHRILTQELLHSKFVSDVGCLVSASSSSATSQKISNKNKKKNENTNKNNSPTNIRFSRSPSIVAEVWAQTVADGLISLIENKILPQCKKEISAEKNVVEEELEEEEEEETSTTTRAMMMKQEKKRQRKQEQEELFASLSSSAQLFSILLSSRDHLLFRNEALSKITLLAFDIIDVIGSLLSLSEKNKNISVNSISTTATSHFSHQQQQQQQQQVLPLSVSYCDLVCSLASSLRIRNSASVLHSSSSGSCSWNQISLTQHLLTAIRLSVNSPHVGDLTEIFSPHSVSTLSPPELARRLCLPLKLSAEYAVASCCSGKLCSPSNPMSSVGFVSDDQWKIALQVFTSSISRCEEGEKIFVQRRQKHFEERVEELLLTDDSFRESLAKKKKKKNNNNENNDDEKISEEELQREQHLRHMMKRDQKLLKDLGDEINVALLKNARLLVRCLLLHHQFHNNNNKNVNVNANNNDNKNKKGNFLVETSKELVNNIIESRKSSKLESNKNFITLQNLVKILNVVDEQEEHNDTSSNNENKTTTTTINTNIVLRKNNKSGKLVASFSSSSSSSREQQQQQHSAVGVGRHRWLAAFRRNSLTSVCLKALENNPSSSTLFLRWFLDQHNNNNTNANNSDNDKTISSFLEKRNSFWENSSFSATTNLSLRQLFSTEEFSVSDSFNKHAHSIIHNNKNENVNANANNNITSNFNSSSSISASFPTVGTGACRILPLPETHPLCQKFVVVDISFFVNFFDQSNNNNNSCEVISSLLSTTSKKNNEERDDSDSVVVKKNENVVVSEYNFSKHSIFLRHFGVEPDCAVLFEWSERSKKEDGEKEEEHIYVVPQTMKRLTREVNLF